MLNRLLCSPCFAGAILIAVPVMANAPTPSQEFWEYMAEYSDENGNVLDPLEYEQILSMKENDTQPKDAEIADEQAAANQTKIRNTNMKHEQKSSLQHSSSGTKGAKL